MGQKVEIHEFSLDIYPRKIWVCVTNNPDCIKDKFYDETKNGEFVFDKADLYEAMAMPSIKKDGNYKGVMIMFLSKKYMTPKNIVHESIHAGKMIFEGIGADIRPHEPFEYLCGWIADKIWQVKTNNLN